MIERIYYAITLGWQHRQELKQICQDLNFQSPSVLEIDFQQLKALGIVALAIDFDGVLAPYGEVILGSKISEWLKACVANFGSNRVFILTNKPNIARGQYFSDHFPEIVMITGKRKKPYPDGVLSIISLAQISPNQLLVIDDRLLTGILAATIAKTKALYITKPYISYLKRPVQELFFMSLRILEKLWFKCWL